MTYGINENSLRRKNLRFDSHLLNERNDYEKVFFI
jgi:hypothetical protein